MGAGQTTGHLRLPTDTVLRSTAPQSQFWWDWTSHHLCSWERDIPAASASASGDHCPIRDPLLRGRGHFPLPGASLDLVFPPRAASYCCQARAAPSTKDDLNPRGAERLPLPKKELLLGVLGSSRAEMEEKGRRGQMSMGGTAWDSGKARRATRTETQTASEHHSLHTPRCPCALGHVSSEESNGTEGGWACSPHPAPPVLPPPGGRGIGSVTTTTSR